MRRTMRSEQEITEMADRLARIAMYPVLSDDTSDDLSAALQALRWVLNPSVGDHEIPGLSGRHPAMNRLIVWTVRVG